MFATAYCYLLLLRVRKLISMRCLQAMQVLRMPTSPPGCPILQQQPSTPAACITYSLVDCKSVLRHLLLLDLRPPSSVRRNGDHATDAVANAAGLTVQVPRRTAAVRRGEASAAWKRGQHLPATAVGSFTGAPISSLCSTGKKPGDMGMLVFGGSTSPHQPP